MTWKKSQSDSFPKKMRWRRGGGAGRAQFVRDVTPSTTEKGNMARAIFLLAVAAAAVAAATRFVYTLPLPPPSDPSREERGERESREERRPGRVKIWG